MIIDLYNISELPPTQYIELLECNIKFAKRHNKLYNNTIYPRLPETYEVIAVETNKSNFILYIADSDYSKEFVSDVIQINSNNALYRHLYMRCSAVISKENKVVKNRWGDNTDTPENYQL